MNPRASVLARRREMLVRRSAHLRERIGEDLQALQPALSWADRLQDAWHWVREHPLAVAGGLGTLALWRPRRTLGLGLRAWSAWRMLRRLGALRAWHGLSRR